MEKFLLFEWRKFYEMYICNLYINYSIYGNIDIFKYKKMT